MQDAQGKQLPPGPAGAGGQRLAIRLHEAQRDLVLWRHDAAQSERLVLCFSGIGKRDEDVPGYEFARIATGNGKNNAVFVSDPTRQWLNGPGQMERLVELLRAQIERSGAREIHTLGHSMGGFAAIVLSRFLPVRSVVAFSPQFSVHPDLAADDGRWMYYRRHIAEHRLRGLDDYLVPGALYHVFHGDDPAEAPQRDMFPAADNLFHYVLPGMGHAPMPRRLKKRGLLEPLVRACFNGRVRRVRQMLEPLGAVRRQGGKDARTGQTGADGTSKTQTAPQQEHDHEI